MLIALYAKMVTVAIRVRDGEERLLKGQEQEGTTIIGGDWNAQV